MNENENGFVSSKRTTGGGDQTAFLSYALLDPSTSRFPKATVAQTAGGTCIHQVS